MVLAEIERRTGRRTAELFDLIAGTSTGGILACGLTRPAADGAGGPAFSAADLNAALRRYLGATRLSETLADVLITAYEIERRTSFLFRSSRARTEPAHDFTLVDAARATAAAPTYFEPVRVRDVAGAQSWTLVDGGVFATNPAMIAYAELAAAGRREEVDLVVSLGTGSHTRRLPYETVRG